MLCQIVFHEAENPVREAQRCLTHTAQFQIRGPDFPDAAASQV
jgi:hypothetical protein